MSYDSQAFIKDLDEVLRGIRDLLIYKNEKYGNSALSTDGAVFGRKLSVRDGLHVRMNDKLKRLKQGDGDDEDTAQDLLGYLILDKIAIMREIREFETNFPMVEPANKLPPGANFESS